MYAEAKNMVDLQFSKDLVVTSENCEDKLKGTFYDNTNDGDEVYVSWTKRVGKGWKPCICGSKREKI